MGWIADVTAIWVSCFAVGALGLELGVDYGLNAILAAGAGLAGFLLLRRYDEGPLRSSDVPAPLATAPGLPGYRAEAEFRHGMLRLRCRQCLTPLPGTPDRCPGCGRTIDWELSAEARRRWEQRHS